MSAGPRPGQSKTDSPLDEEEMPEDRGIKEGDVGGK